MIKYFLESLKEEGWTQLEIAAKAGINQSLVCKLIKGGDCNTKTLIKIAKAFNVTTDTVLGLNILEREKNSTSKGNSYNDNLRTV